MRKITDKAHHTQKIYSACKGGLNLTVETLGWIVDNADLIIGAITGVVTGMAAK